MTLAVALKVRIMGIKRAVKSWNQHKEVKKAETELLIIKNLGISWMLEMAPFGVSENKIPEKAKYPKKYTFLSNTKS